MVFKSDCINQKMLTLFQYIIFWLKLTNCSNILHYFGEKSNFVTSGNISLKQKRRHHNEMVAFSVEIINVVFFNGSKGLVKREIP